MTNQNNEKSKNGKRIALILLALLLIAAIAFGAYTYSKYISQKSGSGSASVAKWGFTITASNVKDTDDTNIFGQYYGTSGTEQDGKDNAVIAGASSEDVVAPGANGSFRFSVTGNAEVQATLKTEITKVAEEQDIQDVYLTLSKGADSSKVTIEYHPILFTLKKAETSDGTYNAVTGYENITLSQLESKISTDTNLNQASIAPNSSALTFYYELTWSWAFEIAEAATLYTNNEGVLTAYNDAKFGTDAINALDTVLGQLSYNNGDGTDVTIETATVTDTNSQTWTVDTSTASTKIAFALKISVTQSGIDQQ